MRTGRLAGVGYGRGRHGRCRLFRPHRWPLGLLGLATLIALAVAVAAAANPNIVSNGKFDSDTAGWSTDGGTIAWDADDANGDPASGSLRLMNDLPYPYDNTAYAVQCVDIAAPGTNFELRGQIRVPAGQDRLLAAFLWAIAYPEPACGGVSLAQSWITVDTNIPAWTTFSDTGEMQPGSRSVKVILAVTKRAPGPGETATDPVIAYFDSVFFGEAAEQTWVVWLPLIARD